MKEFYYNKKMLLRWAICSFILFGVSFLVSSNMTAFAALVCIVRLLALSFCLGMVYVCVKPHRLARIDEEGITIDSNVKLKWSDIEKVEHLKCKCFCRRDFMRFKLKKSAKYQLRIMQKISAMSKYGAFSIPLYAMTSNDAIAIEQEIMKHLTLKSKIKSAVKRMFKPSKNSSKLKHKK